MIFSQIPLRLPISKNVEVVIYSGENTIPCVLGRYISGFYLFEWPDGCRQGSEVLMVVRGEGDGLDVGFYHSSPPKRQFVDNHISAWSYGEVYKILPTSFSEDGTLISDTCMSNKNFIWCHRI